MTTTYTTSKGEVKQIAHLPYPYLCSALAKLEREQPDRTAEITAMRAEVAKRDKEFAAEGVNPRATVGGNMPPADPVEPAPAPNAATFDALKTHLTDLHDEAKNWLDGNPIESQEQADKLGELLGAIVEASKETEKARKAEAEPFDKGKKAVQDKYNPVLKAAETDVQVGKRALGAWEAKVRAQAAAAAAKAAAEAKAAADAAAAAIREANAAGDLAKREEAELAAKAAAKDAKAATKIETARPVTQIGGRPVQMRTYHDAAIDDFFAAQQYFTANYPDELEAWMLDLARKEVASGHRQIPGIHVTSEERAA